MKEKMKLKTNKKKIQQNLYKLITLRPRRISIYQNIFHIFIITILLRHNPFLQLYQKTPKDEGMRQYVVPSADDT